MKYTTVFTVLLFFGCKSPTEEGNNPPPEIQESVVTVEKEGQAFVLKRNGRPCFIKGIGGNADIDLAAARGANSLRTWGTQNAARDLENAQTNGMSVYLNLWLSHNGNDYSDQDYLDRKRDELETLLILYKNHPALLMWSLGNENYLASGRNPKALQFVNELAELIHEKDPDHPVATILVGTGTRDINDFVKYAPAVDILAINAYGALSVVHQWIEASDYDGPYIVTEWGVNGHWEVGKTTWGWPVEPTSTKKADMYLNRYTDHILAHNDRCLGSYVFYWGRKQERTPTWFSMFIEKGVPGIDLNGESCAAVDVMEYCWTGVWPENRAPEISAMTLNGRSAGSSVTLAAGNTYTATVTAGDPEGDTLTYIWEVLEEPTDLGEFGSAEKRPGRSGPAVTTTDNSYTMPGQKPGRYILFAYVFDGNGHAATANVPFKVR